MQAHRRIPGAPSRAPLVAALLVAGALAAGASLAPAERLAPSLEASRATLFDAVTLLRWGHGALDWLLPDPTGDSDDQHDRNRYRR